MSSSSSVSETVIIREFAWNPLCAVIISVNSLERSTFDISREDVTNAPVPAWPGITSFALPEFEVAVK